MIKFVICNTSYKPIITLLVLGSVFLISLCALGSASGDTVSVWLTTGDDDYENKLTQQKNINLVSGDGDNSWKILVDENTPYQEMEGFGASMTDSSAWLLFWLSKTDPNKYETVMKALFDRNEGIGISYIRLPMGASDFSLTSYTYDDMPLNYTDENLTFFSIQHDKLYIIPVLQKAKEINPQIKFMASPWSAPAWMKLNKNLNGGSLNQSYRQAYANYFVKFIKAYHDEGIPIDSVTVQNEPQHETTEYPSMKMEWREQADFVIYYLGPAFLKAKNEDANFSTKILIWDHNCDSPCYALEILNKPGARNFINGTAWHGYYGGPDQYGYTPGKYISESLNRTHEEYKDKDMYFTERTASTESEDLKRAFKGSDLVWHCGEIFIPATRNWSRTVLMWNMVLDENRGPKNRDSSNCIGLVTINMSNGGEPYYETEYYVLGHFSKFVDRGASRIESTTYEDPETVAFENQDHSIVLIVLNNDDTNPKSFDVQWHDQHFSYTLQKQSIVTFIWNQTATA